MTQAKQDSARPLEGAGLLDLTGSAASGAGKGLADLGANVILVGSPGDSCARSLGPFKDDGPEIENGL